MKNLEISFQFYAQRAVVVYYRMTRMLLRLCEVRNLALFTVLRKKR